jgi:hypothetical protein
VTFSFWCSAIVQEDSSTVSMIRELRDEVRGLRIASVNPENSSVTGTPAHHGEEIMRMLKSSGCYTTIEASASMDEASILSKETVRQGQELVKDKKKEDHLVALYTPGLQAVVAAVNKRNSTDYQLVNSEAYVWFKQGNSETKDMKPDLFTTSRENFFSREGYKNAPACATDRHFGTFPFWRCRG